MASDCRQRALYDQTKRTVGDCKTELQRAHRAAPTDAAESLANQTGGDSGTQKGISPKRRDEFMTRGQDQNKKHLVQSKDMSTTDTVASQKREKTPLYDTRQEKEESISAEQHCRENIQDSGQNLTNVDLCSSIDPSTTQTEPSSQSKLQSKQNREQQ